MKLWKHQHLVFLFQTWEYILDKNGLIKHFKINLHSILLKKIDHLTKSFRDGCWCLFIWLKTLLQVNVSLEIIATISTCIWNKLILGSSNLIMFVEKLCWHVLPPVYTNLYMTKDWHAALHEWGWQIYNPCRFITSNGTF